MQKAYVKWFSQSSPGLHCLLGNKRVMVALMGVTVLQMYVGSCCMFDLDHCKQSTLKDKIYGSSSGDERRPFHSQIDKYQSFMVNGSGPKTPFGI